MFNAVTIRIKVKEALKSEIIKKFKRFYPLSAAWLLLLFRCVFFSCVLTLFLHVILFTYFYFFFFRLYSC